MKRALLPILVLVAGVVVGAIVWLNKSSTATTLTPDTQSAAHGSTSGALGEKEAALSPDEARAQAERAGAASVMTHNDGPALDGQIEAPTDCTADDSVEVFGLSREADIDALFAAIGPVGAGDDALGDVELSRLVIARTKMDMSGHFHLVLPTGTHKTHILFAGRSWFLRESYAVQLKDLPPGGVVLRAECGGWVSGRIDLPAAAASRAHELDGQVAVLRPALGGFNPGQRGGFRRVERRASVNGLEFEVRALDPTLDYSLEMVPKTMAAVKVDVADVVRGRATPVALSMANGGTVSGRAIGPNGEAIAGARVEARVKGQFFGFDDRVVRTAESLTDGSFTLSAVAPGSVEISANSKDHVAAEPKKLDIADGGSTPGVDLVLGAGETIAGVVTWKDGSLAVGATVTANAERGGGRNNFGGPGGRGPGRGEDPVATTDEQGRFVLKGLSGSAFTANAEALSPTDATAAAQSTQATKRKLSWRARTTGVKAGATDVALVLEAPIVVKGTVLSAADGTPVKHFNVRAQPGGRNNGGPGFGGQGFGGPGGGQGGGRNSEDVDDERGEFVLGGLREGTWRFEIAADGFAPPDAIEITLPAKSGDPAPVFRLVKAALVNGTVTSPSGAPVANATVSEASSGGAPWMGGGGNQADVHARTDANGHFRIDGMKAGRMVLVAESKEWARSNEVNVDFVAGVASADIVLVMHTGGRITGEVFEDGRPAVGRSINATQTATFTNLSARTDGRGAFAIDHVEAGNWRIVALPSAEEMANGGGDGGRGNMFSRMKSASIDVVDGQEAHVVIGAPPADPVKVSGKVTQGGEGVAGARVMFLGSGQPMGPGTKNVQTGTDGTYSIQLDTAGDYSVTVQAQGGGGGPGGGRGGGMNMVEFVETIHSGADVVLDLALPSARISGVVRTPEGDPAARVRVLLEPATQTVGGSMMGAGFSDVSTDADGAFDIQTLRAGKYVLTIGGSRNAFRGGGGPPGGGDAQYGKKTMDVQLAESEWRRDIDVRLEKAASVAVEVVDDGGNKVANANVFARDAAGRTVDRLSTVRTDAEGNATYSGLSAGRYTFSARKGSQVSGESSSVQVSDGGSSSARVTLANGTVLFVTTIGSDGSAQRAQVSVLDEAGHDVAGMMTMQDLTQRFQSGGPGSNEQKVGPLSSGKYRVHATTTDGHSADKTLTLSGEAESRITLTMSG